MPKIAIEVKNCKDCPFLVEKPVYTADSFERPHDWLCGKSNEKKISGYVDWYEEKDIEIPEWCPIKITTNE